MINKGKKHQAKLLWLDSFTQYDNPAVADIVGPADVIVVQRNFITHEIWKAMDYWRGLGKAIIADLDDGYPTLPWSNPAHGFWIENKANLPFAPVQLMMDGLKHCDALCSPSKVILDDWKSVVFGLHLPNFAYGAWYNGLESIRKSRVQDKIIIGWGGSVSHYDSFWFSGIREALAKVCRARPNTYVKLCGNDPRMLEQLDIPAEQKIYQPGVSPQEWPKVIATFDIGIAPLDLREGLQSYDQRRSWLKAVEYMLVGIPWIASQSEPYRDLESYGVVVENTEQAWTDALLRMVDNFHVAEQKAKRIRHVAWNYTLERNIDVIIGTYEKAVGLRRSTNGLPNVFYVNWEGTPKSVIANPETPSTPSPPEPGLLREIQRTAYVAAQRWHHDLSYNGIPLGECMAYDVLQWVNNSLVSHVEKTPQ